MTPIPKKLREELSNDPEYKKCALAGLDCRGRIQWHHNAIYGGRQINERFAILPVCVHHHEIVYKPAIKESLDIIMFSRATEEDRKKYPLLKWQ